MIKMAHTRFILLLLSLFVILFASGQVNTEKFRKYSDKKGLLFNAGFRFGYSGGNSEYVSFDGTARLDYNGNHNNGFLVANLDYKETDAGKVTHKGFVHLRGIHPLSKKVSLEGFLQQEFNEFLLMADRKLAGGSVRAQLLGVKSKADSLTTFYSNLGLGMMYEREVYDTGMVENKTVIIESARISSYLTLDWTIKEKINIWSVLYFQPKIDDFANFRTVFEAGMEIWVIGQLYLTFDISHRYNNRPIGDVKSFDVLIKNGLRLAIP